jgi:hypothetical protein
MVRGWYRASRCSARVQIFRSSKTLGHSDNNAGRPFVSICGRHEDEEIGGETLRSRMRNVPCYDTCSHLRQRRKINMLNSICAIGKSGRNRGVSVWILANRLPTSDIHIKYPCILDTI